MPAHIDHGRPFDYSRTSKDYAIYRPALPAEFFARLHKLGIGVPGQRILDLGTGTGVVARTLARQGAIVTGVDISDGQIMEARRLAELERLSVEFHVGSAEAPPVEKFSFDVAIANQAFLYFDKVRAVQALTVVLTQAGRLVLSQFRRSSDEDPIAAATDALVKKYNPLWGENDFGGGDLKFQQWIPDGVPDEFSLEHFVRMDFALSFSREAWQGRIRATRGIGASLTLDEVAAFDIEHRRLLECIAPVEFDVKHRLEAQIYRLK